MNVLILLAHPNLPESRINATLREAVRDISGVHVHDLYSAYPDGFIDVAREQELLLAHDVIVMQFPMYWYSTPPLLKAWQDTVLTHGWAYGSKGVALAGKSLLLAVSIGGDQAGYGREHGQFTLTELLRPLEATACFCKLHFLGHVAHGAEDTDLHERLPDMAASYRALVQRLVAGDLPLVVDSR